MPLCFFIRIMSQAKTISGYLLYTKWKWSTWYPQVYWSSFIFIISLSFSCQMRFYLIVIVLMSIVFYVPGIGYIQRSNCFSGVLCNVYNSDHHCQCHNVQGEWLIHPLGFVSVCIYSTVVYNYQEPASSKCLSPCNFCRIGRAKMW
jgi:hypothetical protein